MRRFIKLEERSEEGVNLRNIQKTHEFRTLESRLPRLELSIISKLICSKDF